jgi:hypothetical protein
LSAEEKTIRHIDPVFLWNSHTGTESKECYGRETDRRWRHQ